VVLSSGQTIELTRSAIVGRNPRVEGTMHGEVPSTLKIEGNQALSRSHAIIRLEGWQVMVEDLDSANGTTVTLQGRPPRRLRAGEPVILEHGALIDFGGEVTGTYDALA
jgi:pSer/pThr/pTyr-binding forkhead associated (FHA) protein